MTILNGYTNAVPHHRQNRRRERPGSRARRSISRKFEFQDECEQGIFNARDTSILLPSDKAKPSPLLRQNFDQSWQRWKARQVEEAAQAEKDKLELERERMLLFGGEVDDDELFHMGILYFDGDQQDCESHAKENTVLCDAPLRQEAPLFVIRPSRRSRRQRPKWRSLPLYLSSSDLSSDTIIAWSIPPIPHNTPPIQHRTPIPFTTANIIDIDIDPQSLLSNPASSHQFQLNGFGNILDIDTHFVSIEDWTFITYTQHNSTPSSEPETWILCDDS